MYVHNTSELVTSELVTNLPADAQMTVIDCDSEK